MFHEGSGLNAGNGSRSGDVMGSFRPGYPMEVVGGESPGRGIEVQEVGDPQEAGMIQMPVTSRRSPGQSERLGLRATNTEWVGARDITPSHVALYRQAPYPACWRKRYLEILPHPAGEADGRLWCCRSGEDFPERIYTSLVSEGIPLTGERLRSLGGRDVRGERRCQQRSAR
jgi:hypothetical protein